MQRLSSRFDVVVVGGGHNGLAAAAYLAQAGLYVLVVEQSARLGGAVVSEQFSAEIPVRISPYSYLVSLLPKQLVDELELRVVLRRRAVTSYSPRPDGPGLFIANDHADATARSFEQVSGSTGDHNSWREFCGGVRRAAARVFPTLLQPMATRQEIRRLVDDEPLWRAVVEEPLGASLRSRFSHDVVRGAVLTDAVLGTFATADDPSLTQNRCFLFHTLGRGTGDWDVPVGGMGTLTEELARAARAAGARLLTRSRAVQIDPGNTRHPATLQITDGDGTLTVAAGHVLLAAACPDLHRQLDIPGFDGVEGSQFKVDLVLSRLPRLREDVDPGVAFAGTMHVNQAASQLESAYQDAAAGRLPTTIPVDATSHSLTDPSILGPGLRGRGVHTLALFAMHLPYRLFTADNNTVRAQALAGVFASLNSVLAEPIEDCLLTDAQGRPCVRARTPVDLERELGLPGGNIFHRPLDWPFAESHDDHDRWGVDTGHPRVLLAGAGARRGGGVSGIAGRNAAMAVLGH